MTHKVLDLFSGIGGFSLGLERTGGFETVAFCEIDKYCQKVLNKHWAAVPIYEDIKELTNERLRADGIVPSVIVGGFPCQDLCGANTKGKGLKGERSGLFYEVARLVREIRPKYCVLENVARLLRSDLYRILAEFAEIGNYEIEWHSISAAHMGSPHKRDRVWIIAREVSDTKRDRLPRWNTSRHPIQERLILSREQEGHQVGSSTSRCGEPLRENETPIVRRIIESDFWKTQSCPRGVSDGVSFWMERIACLGNSLVPQIPEHIGNAIIEHEARRSNT